MPGSGPVPGPGSGPVLEPGSGLVSGFLSGPGSGSGYFPRLLHRDTLHWDAGVRMTSAVVVIASQPAGILVIPVSSAGIGSA